MHENNLLQTSVTLTSGEVPLGVISVFDSGEFETRMNLPPDLARGNMVATKISDELGIINTELMTSEESFLASLHASQNQYKFTFILSGRDSYMSLEGIKKPYTVRKGNTVLFSSDLSIRDSVPSHGYMHNICIAAGVDRIEPILCSLYLEEGKHWKRLLEHKRDALFVEDSLTPSMRMVLEQFLNCPYTGGLKKLYYEAKSLELITLRLEQFLHTDRSRDIPRLSCRDRERIREAETILVSRMQDPPSLGDLARIAGINTKKLKEGFKEIFGTTAFDYLHKKRMESARELLAGGGYTVSEAMWEVGYNNLSHFSASFRREFGVPPSVYLKHLRERE